MRPSFLGGKDRRCLCVAAVLSVIGWPALAAEPANESKPEADAARAMRVFRALQSLGASVRDEGGRTTVASPSRPAKVVRPPSLDAAQVDALVDEVYRAKKAKPAPLVDDETFARRVSLDIAGKLPSPEALERFRKNTDKDKRARLIDDLLAGPDYPRNWARYWREVIQFHGSNPNQFQVRYPVLEDWLAEKLAKNAPWDEVARGLITGAGRNDEEPTANFAIAQMGQPVEMAGEVSRVFMGVQIQCAQCHDHPNDTWTRKQFHEFAAFFAGLRNPRLVSRPMQGQLPVFMAPEQPGRPRYTMPDLKDPKVQIAVAPRFFLASSEQPVPDGLTSRQRRELAASYVTGQDNPWFAKAYVNRIWYALMGTGFYNPVDDIGPTRQAEAPEVLEALASQWQQGGYDVRWLFRTILNTRAYQRAVRPATSPAAASPLASSVPARLRADQILDALGQALDVPFDRPLPGQEPGRMGNAGGQNAIAAAYRRAFRNPRNLFSFLFGVDPSTAPEDVLGTIPQALFMMNFPRINQAIEARDGSVLGKILAGHAGDRDALEALYLRVLARRPNAKELEVCADYIKQVGDRNEAFEDIFWNLINSTEFLSRR